MNSFIPVGLPRRLLVTAGPVLFAPVLALAQSASSPAATTTSSTPEDEPVVMSVFEVTADQDRGYLSANTQAGARIAVPIRELPMSISVLNRELLDDLAITDTFQASRLSAGGEFANRPDNDTNFSFRGVNTAYNTRNYFQWFLPTDTYNAERIEILRGPQGVLYGDATPGGLLNVSTKRADPRKDFAKLTLRVDENESIRTSIDVNRRAGPRLAARLNAVWSDAQSWKDFIFNETKAAHLALSIQATPTTSLRLEGEYGDIERNNAANVYVDQYSGLNFAGSTLGPGAGPRHVLMPDGTLLLNNGTNQNAGQGAAAGQGIRQSNGSGSFITDPNAFGGLVKRSRSWSGPSGRENRVYTQVAAFLEQRFGDDLTLELAYNLQDQTNSIFRPANSFNIRQDPTPVGGTIITNTTVNPASAVTGVNPNAGRYFIDHVWIKQVGGNYVQDYRATAAYVLDRFSFTRQRFVFTGGIRTDHNTFLGYNEGLKADPALIVGGGTTAGNNLSNNSVNRRFYLDSDYRRLAHRVDPRVDFFPTAFGFDQETKLEYYSAAVPGSFKIAGKDRVYTLLGFRRDTFTNDAIGGAAGPGRDAFGNVIFTAPRANAVDVTRDSRNFGAVVRLHDSVSVYANYGESFRPISGVRLDGTNFGAQDGEGVEYGVKVDLFGGRVSGAVAIYDIENKNSVFNLAGAVANELRAIFPGLPTGFNPQDSQDVVSQGYEVEVILNPLEGWTASLNYSYNKADTTNIAPAVKNLRSQINATTNPTGLPTTNIDNFLAGLVEPVPNAGVRPRSFNAFTRYNFQSGRLKGAYVGGGVQWRSETFLGFTLPVPAPTVAAQIVAQRRAEYSPAYTTANLLLGYSFKPTDRISANIALNVENLFDEVYVNAFVRGFGQWGNPRTFVLTTTLGF